MNLSEEKKSQQRARGEFTPKFCLCTYSLQGRVVRKPINANPGLKVNRSNRVSCINMSFTAYVLCNLRLFKPKTEGQGIQTEKLTKTLQVDNQNFRALTLG